MVPSGEGPLSWAPCPRCPKCGKKNTKYTLPAGDGHYCLCRSCGHAWHTNETANPPSEPKRIEGQ